MIEKVSQEPRAWAGDIPVTNLYTAGIAGERFLREIQEKGRLVGTRCTTCNLVYLPARLYCERCFARLDQNWMEVPRTGRVHTWTVARIDLDGKPLKEPTPVAMVTFEGVHGGILHKLIGVAPEAIKAGMVVEPVFVDRKKRKGSILDIAGFRPARKK